ncbi:hypothetical protein FHT92_005192 [Rhizobium sp. BK377]|jgi:hypothetical protein|nr:hypothetical protein [Rhizobium sp. BK377]
MQPAVPLVRHRGGAALTDRTPAGSRQLHFLLQQDPTCLDTGSLAFGRADKQSVALAGGSLVVAYTNIRLLATTVEGASLLVVVTSNVMQQGLKGCPRSGVLVGVAKPVRSGWRRYKEGLLRGHSCRGLPAAQLVALAARSALLLLPRLARSGGLLFPLCGVRPTTDDVRNSWQSGGDP